MPTDDMLNILDEEINARIRYATLGFSQGGRMVLGGTAGAGGGVGGPPGGFVGQLAQRYVTYDTSEEATLEGEDSLVDNLNHIRYRIQQLEENQQEGVTTFVDLEDTPNTYQGHAYKFVRVNSDETALEFTQGTFSSVGIYLIRANNFIWFEISESGFSQALSDALPGDTIFIPTCTLSIPTVVLSEISLIGQNAYIDGNITAIKAKLTGISCKNLSIEDSEVFNGTFNTVTSQGTKSSLNLVSVSGDITVTSGELYIYSSKCMGDFVETTFSISPVLIDSKDIFQTLPPYPGATSYALYQYDVTATSTHVFYSLCRHAFSGPTLLAREGFIVKTPLSLETVSDVTTVFKLPQEPSIPFEISVYKKYLYIVDLYSFTVVDHTTMTVLDSYTQSDLGLSPDAFQHSLSVGYPYVYVTGSCGFIIYDVSIPNSIELKYINTSLHGEAIRYNKNYVYISSYDGYIRIINVGNPNQPVVTYNAKLFSHGSGTSFNKPSSIAIRDDLVAFSVEKKNKICLMNVANKESPVQVSLFDSGFVFDDKGHIDFHFYANYLVCSAVRGHYSGNTTRTRLIVFDITTPSAPYIVYNAVIIDSGTGDGSGTAHSVVVKNCIIINSNWPTKVILERLSTPHGICYTHAVVTED